MKCEMAWAGFCCGLIVCNKYRRLFISHHDSKDVAFINKERNFVQWSLIVSNMLILQKKKNKQSTFENSPCY